MLSVAPHIRVIADNDGSILVDIKNNATFGLDSVSSHIWSCLQNDQSSQQIVDSICKDTGANPATVETDVTNFLQLLQRKKMIVQGTQRFRRSAAICKALLLLAIYDIAVPPLPILRRRSLWIIHCALSWIRVAAIQPAPDVTDKISEAINVACTWYPKSVKCLQRSVVGAILLRRYGVSASFVAAARRLPYHAHAWLEVDGKIVNDNSELADRLIVFERC